MTKCKYLKKNDVDKTLTMICENPYLNEHNKNKSVWCFDSSMCPQFEPANSEYTGNKSDSNVNHPNHYCRGDIEREGKDSMKGLIVCGYPGVGKSSIAGWNKYIDLESSYFSHRPTYVAYDDSYVNIPIRANIWTKQYCPIAIDLANQGFIVMTSCHKPVIEYFMSAIYPKNVSGAVIFAPDSRYKKEWIDRLTERYNKTKLQKDEQALTRAIQYFDEDIAFLNNCGLPIYTPATLDYDLKDYINYIVAKKEN